MIEAILFWSHKCLVGSTTVGTKTSLLAVSVRRNNLTRLFIAIGNTILGSAVTIVSSNLVNCFTRNWKRNRVRIRKILCERVSIGIGIGSQIRTQCSIKQIADLTAMQRVGSFISRMLTLEVAGTVESVVAVGNRTVGTTEKLVNTIQNTYLCNVQTVPHLGVTSFRLVPSAESRTFVYRINATSIHAVFHIEATIFVATCTNHTSCSGSGGKSRKAYTIQNLKRTAICI